MGGGRREKEDTMGTGAWYRYCRERGRLVANCVASQFSAVFAGTDTHAWIILPAFGDEDDERPVELFMLLCFHSSNLRLIGNKSILQRFFSRYHPTQRRPKPVWAACQSMRTSTLARRHAPLSAAPLVSPVGERRSRLRPGLPGDESQTVPHHLPASVKDGILGRSIGSEPLVEASTTILRRSMFPTAPTSSPAPIKRPPSAQAANTGDCARFDLLAACDSLQG